MTRLESEKDGTVAVFSHAGVLRNFLNLAVGMNLPSKHVLCRNCTVAVFAYTGSYWVLHSWINLS